MHELAFLRPLRDPFTKFICFPFQTSRLTKFANKETGVELLENVRGQGPKSIENLGLKIA